jgi:transcriptional antiterminator NusG
MTFTHRWYTVRTYAGKELYVKKAILSLIEEDKLHNRVKDVIVPTEDVIEVKNGKKRITERSLYSGYVFANMLLDSENFLLSKISSIPKVSGFVGESGHPTPLSEEDISKILERVNNRGAPRPKVAFEKGESVRIVDGSSFANFIGIVEQYDVEHGKLTLNVPIFGRNTPVEIQYSQVEKIEES